MGSLFWEPLFKTCCDVIIDNAVMNTVNAGWAASNIGRMVWQMVSQIPNDHANRDYCFHGPNVVLCVLMQGVWFLTFGKRRIYNLNVLSLTKFFVRLTGVKL